MFTIERGAKVAAGCPIVIEEDGERRQVLNHSLGLHVPEGTCGGRAEGWLFEVAGGRFYAEYVYTPFVHEGAEVDFDDLTAEGLFAVRRTGVRDGRITRDWPRAARRQAMGPFGSQRDAMAALGECHESLEQPR